MPRIRQDKTNNRFVYLLLCLSILTVPVNISFFNIIRLPDIFFVISFIKYTMNNPSIKYTHVMILSTFFIILILSNIISLKNNSNINYSGLVFYYKYFLIFLIPWIVSDIINNKKRLIGIVSKLYYIYLILIIWAPIY